MRFREKSSLSEPRKRKRWLWFLVLLPLLLLIGNSTSAVFGFNPIAGAGKVIGLQGPTLTAIGINLGKVNIQTTNNNNSNNNSGNNNNNNNNNSSNSEISETGQEGEDGINGTIGANGQNGAPGKPGSNDCIAGICVSRQAGSPGVKEVGSINITGEIIANSVSADGSNVTNLNADNVASGTLDVANGGTGVDGSSAPNGSLLIGNGSGYSLGTITAGTGISVTNGSGSITIASTGAAVACDITSNYVCNGGNTTGSSLTVGTNDATSLDRHRQCQKLWQ